MQVFELFFGELTKPQQRKFMNHPFPAIETRNLSIEECKDIYDRLAYGGTNHVTGSNESGQVGVLIQSETT